MRKPLAVLGLASLLLVVLSSSGARGQPQHPTQTFTIELPDVRPAQARTDLINLFVRTNANQTQINLTLANRKVSRGRAAPKFFYLENLRVRPGDVVRIVPEGRTEAYEGVIQTIEARFPVNQQPQFLIVAVGDPPEERQQARPFPRLSTEGFFGQRTLDTTAQEGEAKDDVINCNGVTDGDLRIRFGSLVDVVDVGLAFSTVYRITDARHTWNANAGLQTQYTGTRYLTGSGRDD